MLQVKRIKDLNDLGLKCDEINVLVLEEMSEGIEDLRGTIIEFVKEKDFPWHDVLELFL